MSPVPLIPAPPPLVPRRAVKQCVRAAISFLLLLFLSGGTLAAQANSTKTHPTFQRILFGTAAGAVLGAAVIAGPPTWIAHEQDDTATPISGAAIVFVITAPVGWWLGQSAGASWASGEAGARVRMRSLLWPAAVWTVAGIFMSTRVSSGWEVVFPAAALAGTSWSAYQRAHGGVASDSDFALLPSYARGRGFGVSGSFRLGSSH